MTAAELERFAKQVNWTNPPIKEAEERDKSKRASKAAE